jgi:aspartyl-tRNA(Asn)/glutamyl-tRNA(Gln) amidotransferase subunit A
VELHWESAAGTAGRVRRGDLSAMEATEAALARIDAVNPGLAAFLTVTAVEARDAARAVDARRARGEDPGPLAGVAVAVKDNIATRGVRTTCASRMLETHVPLYDATAVERLRAAGAVVVGKTNLDEFGMGSSNENSAFTPAVNPWRPDRVPGGSSGGSAAAVASGMAALALGTDTGGSIRQPAAFCGLHALKPTYGRVSRYGLVAYASSFDQIGGFARSAADLALLYAVLAGPDPRDSTSAPRPVEPVDPGEGAAGLQVGIASDLLERPGVQSEVSAAMRWAAETLRAAGARTADVALPDPETAIGAYYLLATAEASSNLARYDGVRYGLRVPGPGLAETYSRTRSAGFGREVKRRILLGTYALSAGYYDAYYLKAQKARVLFRRAFERIFGEVDLVLLPTAPTTAFRLGEKIADPVAMYLSDLFTVYANLTGMPAANVPVGFDAEGLPVGVQLLAPRWREDLLFRGAGVLEGAHPDPGRRPPWGTP